MGDEGETVAVDRRGIPEEFLDDGRRVGRRGEQRLLEGETTARISEDLDLPPGVGLIEPIDDTSCRLDTGASTYESLAMHLVLLGVDFEVTEPPELLEEIRAMADRYRRSIARPRRGK